MLPVITVGRSANGKSELIPLDGRGCKHMGNVRLILVAVILMTPAHADEWPQWRGPNRNGSGQSVQALSESWGNSGPKRIWSTGDLPGGGASSPVIANGWVYIYIHQWRERVDTVVCLNESTGAKRWEQDFPVGCGTLHEGSGTPCIVGQNCLVMGAHSCYCLDSTTGHCIWKTDTGASSKDPTPTGSRGEFSSSFIVVSGVVVVICGPVFGLDLNSGGILWQADEPGGWSRGITSASGWREKYVIYGGRDRLACLEARTGRVVWNLPGGGRGYITYAPSPVVSGDLLVAFSRGELRGFDLSSGKPCELWHFPYGEEYSTPAADAKFLYLVNPGFTYKNNSDRHVLDRSHYRITCCDLKSGKTVWETPISQCDYSSPIVINDKVFALTDKYTKIAMFGARDGKRLGEAIVGALRWTSPSVANDRLFLRTQHGVVCYDLTHSGVHIRP